MAQETVKAWLQRLGLLKKPDRRRIHPHTLYMAKLTASEQRKIIKEVALRLVDLMTMKSTHFAKELLQNCIRFPVVMDRGDELSLSVNITMSQTDITQILGRIRNSKLRKLQVTVRDEKGKLIPHAKMRLMNPEIFQRFAKK